MGSERARTPRPEGDIFVSDTLKLLDGIINQRKEHADPSGSYVAQLHHKGINKILEKVGEEAFETVIAAKDAAKYQKLAKNESDLIAKSADKDTLDESMKDLVNETADLWFHTLVMLSHLNCNSDDVIRELERRFDLSGLEEKAQRKIR